MIIFKKIYEYLKPILILLITVLLVFTLTSYLISQFSVERKDFSTKLKEIQSIHDAEMKKIAESQQEERRLHEQNLRKLQEDLALSLSRHEEKLKELEKVKEETSKKLLEKYKSDPAGLSRELGRVTGIPVFLPIEKH